MPWPLESRYLDAAATRAGVSFPSGYRSGIAARNGGSVAWGDETWILYPIWDQSTEKRMLRTAEDAVRETQTCRELSWFPKGGFAIAGCNSDRLVLLPSDADEGALGEAVWCWRMRGEGVELAFDSVWDLMARRG